MASCQDDRSDAGQAVAEWLRRVLRTTRRAGNVDSTDIVPASPGTQLDCNVADVRFRNQVGETEKTVRRCQMSGADTPVTSGASAESPCWWVTTNTEKCKDTSTKLELKIERGGQDAPIGTEVVARCMVKG